MKHTILRVVAASVGLLVAVNVMADVTMSIIDPNASAAGSQFCEYAGLSAYLGSDHIINGGEWIGIYAFTVTDNGGTSIDTSTSFYTTCISPNGRLYNGEYTYNTLSFHDASPGMNPAGWAWNGDNDHPQYWGIQNANHLFQNYSGGILSGTSGLRGSGADQGAALALAMYAALYNSTKYGDTSGNAFALNSASPDVTADYIAILGALQGWNPDPASLATGYVLRPTDRGAQDMLLLAGVGPHVTPVPEPTTMIAGFGALGLLLFGAGVHSKRSVLLIDK